MTTQAEPKVEGAEKPSALEQLVEIRRGLQDAGITLLQAATAAITAAAKDTLSATHSVVAAAEGTLEAAEQKLRNIRAQLKNRT